MSTENVTSTGLAGLPAGLKPLLLLVGVAAAVAAGVILVLWWRGPSYSLLYTDLSSSDQAAVAQALDGAAIPYRLENTTNGISVPAERLNDARLKLAGQGLPEGSGGFAVMGKDPGFGVSQFMETARYQHALETELARTIASLRPVEAARVHLAVPRQSAFVRDRQPASASVFIKLKAGKRLEQEQVRSVVNLVASSTPELDAEQVTVVDQQGRLLSSPPGSGELAERQQQFELAARLEEEYAQRIENLLSAFVGPGRVRAQVVAQIDTSISAETREQYRPGSQIVRNEQLSEQISQTAGGPTGVPGALTNQPPVPGSVTPPAAPVTPTTTPPTGTTAAAPAATPENLNRESNRAYEIDRTLAYTHQPSGRLQRLTVAVVVDNLKTTGKDGKVTETALSAEQLTRITQLVKDAVGFNAERGDSVNVVNTSFLMEQPATDGKLESLPLWEQPLIHSIAKMILGFVALLLLILMVIKPLVRGLLAQSRANAAAVTRESPLPLAAAGAAAQSPGTAPLAFEQQVTQARTLVSQDPKRVAQVVKTWVTADG